MGNQRGLKEGCETKVASGSYCGSLECPYAYASLAWPPPCEVGAKRQEMMNLDHATWNILMHVIIQRGGPTSIGAGRILKIGGVFAGGSVTIPQRLDVVEQEHLLPDA